MLIFKDCITYQILEKEITIFSDETAYGRNTVAEIDNYYIYWGAEPWTISTAILSYERHYNRELMPAELRQVLLDNNFISQRN